MVLVYSTTLGYAVSCHFNDVYDLCIQCETHLNEIMWCERGGQFRVRGQFVTGIHFTP